MQEHYSTVDGAEKRTALAKVIHLTTAATVLAVGMVGSTPREVGSKSKSRLSERSNRLVFGD